MDQTVESQEIFPEGFSVGLTKINLKGTPVPLAQILEEIAPQGKRIEKVSLVGKEIVIHHINPFVGDYGPALYVILTDENGEIYNTIISSQILMPKLLAVRNQLPVSCTIVEHMREGKPKYYDFE